MIDWNRVEDLRAEIGDDAFAEVILMFLEETDHEVAGLRAAAPERGLEASLHFLKGSALNLGLGDLARLCAEAERALALCASGVDLAPVLQAYDRARAELVAGMRSRAA